MLINEFPHIYKEIKNLALKRDIKDLEMKNKALSKLAKEERGMYMKDCDSAESIHGGFVEDLPELEEFYEHAKDHFPLEDIVTEVDMSYHQKYQEALEECQAEVPMEELMSIGIERIYHQLQGIQLNSNYLDVNIALFNRVMYGDQEEGGELHMNRLKPPNDTMIPITLNPFRRSSKFVTSSNNLPAQNSLNMTRQRAALKRSTLQQRIKNSSATRGPSLQNMPDFRRNSKRKTTIHELLNPTSKMHQTPQKQPVNSISDLASRGNSLMKMADQLLQSAKKKNEEVIKINQSFARFRVHYEEIGGTSKHDFEEISG